jgi:hypothetical protein
VFRVLSGYGRWRLTIRDGSDISSPVVLKVDYDHRSTINNPFAIVVTTQERISIDVYVRRNYYKTAINFEILSAMPGKFVLQKIIFISYT